MVAWIAPWCAIYAVDIWLRRARYDGPSLLSEDGGQYRYGNGWHRPAFIAWILGVIAALACTSADMLKSPFAENVLGGADLSIVIGLLVSGLLYWILARGELSKA